MYLFSDWELRRSSYKTKQNKKLLTGLNIYVDKVFMYAQGRKDIKRESRIKYKKLVIESQPELK